MTYLQWLQRYVELTIGDGDSTADTALPGSPWLADTWRDRFAEMVKRAEARLHPTESGPIETLFGSGTDGAELLERPADAISALLARYPDAETVQLHPADAPFFVQLCKTLGKPVNFVPVIDKDVRRWWRSDSLWQAHDARYDADQVCIIPGTASVAGITRLDEPVGDLLDRFEQAAIDQVHATGAEAEPVAARRRHRTDVAGPLAVVLDAPRRAVGGPPGHQPGAPRSPRHREWQVHGNRCRVGAKRHGGMSARHTLPPARGWRSRRTIVVLSVPLSGTWIEIPLTLGDVVVDGGTPVVSAEDAATAMRSVLAIAAGVDGPDALPPVQDGTAKVPSRGIRSRSPTTRASPATFGAPLAPGVSMVPDALVGRCWPAVFAAIGAAKSPIPGARRGGPAEPGASGPCRASRHAAACRERPN